MQDNAGIGHVCRPETQFAGIRAPINKRSELIPRMNAVREACGNRAVGPLTHIFRFDTPVDGFDSEIGFAVDAPVETEDIKTHSLRRLDFFTATHTGSIETLHETTGRLFAHMRRTGLSSELELVEVYHAYDPEDESANRIEVQASFLAWPEVYRAQLLRVLGPDLTDEIWAGGHHITPFTEVDVRVAWVAETIDRLKHHTTPDQQFDILSRVALVRPAEDTAKHKTIYEESGRSVAAVVEAQNAELAKGPTGSAIDPWWSDGRVLHLSKVARDRKAYDAAATDEETRRAYCFCNLIREASNPKVDPIFCFRAAGWARQFWEPILGVQFKHCTITHSILKGDPFCAWDYDLTDVA